jgi:hypothetical protein
MKNPEQEKSMDSEKKTGEKIIHEFMKNAGELVRISFTTYKGKKLVNLRVYYQAEDGWRPGPKGLTLRRPMIFDLKEGVDLAALEYEKELPGEETTEEPDIQKPEKDDKADIHPA